MSILWEQCSVGPHLRDQRKRAASAVTNILSLDLTCGYGHEAIECHRATTRLLDQTLDYILASSWYMNRERFVRVAVAISDGVIPFEGLRTPNFASPLA